MHNVLSPESVAILIGTRNAVSERLMEGSDLTPHLASGIAVYRISSPSGTLVRRGIRNLNPLLGGWDSSSRWYWGIHDRMGRTSRLLHS